MADLRVPCRLGVLSEILERRFPEGLQEAPQQYFAYSVTTPRPTPALFVRHCKNVGGEPSPGRREEQFLSQTRLPPHASPTANRNSATNRRSRKHLF